MSSKIVRMLLRSTGSLNTEGKVEVGQKFASKEETRRSKPIGKEMTEKELIALQVDRMLSIDNNESIAGNIASRDRPAKRRKKDRPAVSATMIVTNSRGCAMRSKRIILPTINKRKEEQDKKDLYLKSIAKKLQGEDKEKRKRKRKEERGDYGG